MTITIFELLSKMDEIENQITFIKESVESPCLLIKDISIASSEKEWQGSNEKVNATLKD